MKTEVFLTLLDTWLKKIKDISAKKGHDYANSQDHILNFKNVYKACQIFDVDPRRSPEDVANFFRIVKMLRIVNLRDRDPQNESVLDSELDDLTYHFLYLACKEDKNV